VLMTESATRHRKNNDTGNGEPSARRDAEAISVVRVRLTCTFIPAGPLLVVVSVRCGRAVLEEGAAASASLSIGFHSHGRVRDSLHPTSVCRAFPGSTSALPLSAPLASPSYANQRECDTDTHAAPAALAAAANEDADDMAKRRMEQDHVCFKWKQLQSKHTEQEHSCFDEPVAPRTATGGTCWDPCRCGEQPPFSPVCLSLCSAAFERLFFFFSAASCGPRRSRPVPSRPTCG
jgi:hypothetical protein